MSLFTPRAIRTRLSRILTKLISLYYRKVWGMNIGAGTKISSQAKLDKTNPKGINIGEYSYVTFGCAILSHDMCRRTHFDTVIGDNCFIGCHSVVMPGVTIGDNCIIGAGSLVATDIPPRSIAVGNPARVIRRNIMTSAWGVLIERGEPAPDGDAARPVPPDAA